MPIRYQIAFRGTARPSVCSAWRHKVPKKSVWRIRNPILCRNLLIVSVLFAQAETLYRAETRCFAETFCLFQPYLLKPKPYIVPKLGVFPKPFACFNLICSSRNSRFSWNLERLCISVKPRFAFVISETCKPFSSLSAFSPFSATKAVLRV